MSSAVLCIIRDYIIGIIQNRFEASENRRAIDLFGFPCHGYTVPMANDENDHDLIQLDPPNFGFKIVHFVLNALDHSTHKIFYL